MLNEDRNHLPESQKGQDREDSGSSSFFRYLLEELLTGPLLLMAGAATVALGYFVGFSPLMGVGMLLVLIGLGSIFVW